MNDFCATHVGQRTTERLRDRAVYLRARDEDARRGPLTPGLRAELRRVEDELARRTSSA